MRYRESRSARDDTRNRLRISRAIEVLSPLTKPRREGAIPAFSVRSAEREIEPCFFSQHTQPESLSASIAVNERVSGIYLIHIDSRPLRELSFIPTHKVAFLSKLPELLPHPRGNVLRNCKRDGASPCCVSALFASPRIKVLK